MQLPRHSLGRGKGHIRRKTALTCELMSEDTPTSPNTCRQRLTEHSRLQVDGSSLAALRLPLPERQRLSDSRQQQTAGVTTSYCQPGLRMSPRSACPRARGPLGQVQAAAHQATPVSVPGAVSVSSLKPGD